LFTPWFWKTFELKTANPDVNPIPGCDKTELPLWLGSFALGFSYCSWLVHNSYRCATYYVVSYEVLRIRNKFLIIPDIFSIVYWTYPDVLVIIRSSLLICQWRKAQFASKRRRCWPEVSSLIFATHPTSAGPSNDPWLITLSLLSWKPQKKSENTLFREIYETLIDV
jgi:hypothetical protein